MAYSVFRVPNGVAVSPTGVAQVVSIIQAFSGGGQTADLQQWQNHLGTVLAEVDNLGNISGVGATFSGSAAINGGSITTSAASATLFATPTTVSAFAAATTLNLATTAASSAITIGSSTSTTTIAGNLIVNGTTTTVNSTTINIDDLNLNLASDSGTLSTVDGGGITVGSGLGITLNYDYNSNNPQWTSSQNFNVATTKSYRIAGVDVLNATGIGPSIISSSLKQLGTIATGVWQGTSISTTYTDAKVVSVASANAARISVAGTTNPTIDLALVTQSTGSNFVKVTIDSYGRVTGNTAVASGDIPNHSAAQITAGTLAVAQGGTNLGSYGTGVLLQASGTTISQLSPTTSGLFLRTNGVNTFSTYGALASGDVTTALGYTPANSTTVLSGTGSSGRVTLWNGTSTLTSDAELVYDSSNNTLTIGSGNISATTSDITVSNTPGVPTAIDTFATGVYRAAKYLVTVRSANGDTYQVSEALVTYHPTGNAFVSEYGQIYTQGTTPLITLGADITGGNVRLTAYGPSSPTVRLMRFAITF